jgi:hypothetical protein
MLAYCLRHTGALGGRARPLPSAAAPEGPPAGPGGRATSGRAALALRKGVQ